MFSSFEKPFPYLPFPLLIIFLFLVLAGRTSWKAMDYISEAINQYAVMPADYSSSFQSYSVEWEGMEIFIPIEGDRGSYDAFPSTPYIQTLPKIELRKDNLSDGFKQKNRIQID